MKRTILIIVIIVFGIQYSQSQSFVNISNTGTCENALDISRFSIFGPTTPPEALAKDNESSFNLPIHPTWYKFTVQKNGILLFDIIPQNAEDNYDFMLFKSTDNFCDNYNSNNTKPIRSNFSPPKNAKGLTGLSYNGEAPDFEKGLQVAKGEVYYLALNNVYPEGKGHTIHFKELKTINIKGIVTNKKNNKPIKADIRWLNLDNNTLFVTSQTEKKGSYEMEVLLNNQSNTFPEYELCVFAEKYFPDFVTFSTKEANDLDGKVINFELEKVKIGTNNDGLGVIYFRPNNTKIVPSSENVIRRLLKFMEINDKAQIILEGHTNGLFPSTDVDFELSSNRAKVIKKYLTDHGIDPGRIGAEGMGSKFEVYPIPETEEEEGLNRRVEINVIKF
jgi:outer membrane protein OmpA-like peptidoglycan-associated protein